MRTQQLQIQVALSLTAADPWFPRRGHQHGSGSVGVGATYDLATFSKKKKTEENWTESQ